MGKYLNICLHDLSTPPGRFISKDTLATWHMGPKDQKDGTVKYMGKTYESRAALPDEKIAGIPIIKLHGRGWDRYGYEKMYQTDGSVTIVTLVNEDDWIESHEMTWGATGMNATSVHWALAGGWKKVNGVWKKSGTFEFLDIFSEAQFEKLCYDLKDELVRHPHLKILGHYQAPNAGKTCPNVDVPKVLRSMGIPEKNIYKS